MGWESTPPGSTNIAGWKNPPFQIGHTSSFHVAFSSQLYVVHRSVRDVPAKNIRQPYDRRFFSGDNDGLHTPLKFNIAPEKGNPKRKLIFQPSFFRGYVKFRGCTPLARPAIPMAKRGHFFLRKQIMVKTPQRRRFIFNVTSIYHPKIRERSF